MLTRDQILSVKDRPVEVVDVPEWGGTIGVRTMSGADFVEFQRELRDAATRDQQLVSLLCRTIVDDAGAPIFAGDAGRAALGEKSVLVLLRIAQVAMRLNKMSDEDFEGLKGN